MFIAFSFSLNLHAQTAPVKLWDKTFGGSIGDNLTSFQQTSDGGYFLGGGSYSGISGDKSQGCQGLEDYWIVKLDPSGNKLWDKTFGGNHIDELNSLQQTSDGGYILGGGSGSGISGDKSQASKGADDYWVVKLDANGNKLWDKTFGGSGQDDLFSLKQTTDGGYILGGYSNSPLSGDKSQASRGYDDYWVIKIDSNGNKVWDKTFGGSKYDVLFALQQTSDGGYILGGYSDSGISGDKTQPNQTPGPSTPRDYWVVKLDSNGTKIWDKTFGGFDNDYLYSLSQTSDGGYILGGISKSTISGTKSQTSQGDFDYWVVKIDATGNKTWDKTFDGSSIEHLKSLQQTSDGGYVLGGSSFSGISGDKSQASHGSGDYWVVKLDSIGNKLWDKTVGGSSYETLNSLQQTLDGGYILGGYTGSGISGDKTQVSQGGADYWIVKLAAPCISLNAALMASCSNGGAQISVNVTGIQPGPAGTPSWTLTYTVNGTLQTISGTSHTLELTQNAQPGAVFSLVNIVSGACSTNLINSITVPSVPSVPSAPAVTPGSNCGAGPVTLSATGAPTGGSYVWYSVPTGGVPVYSNPSGVFTIPNLNATTTFYVAAVSNTGCEGPRTPITATINIFPVVNAGSVDTICATVAPIQLSGFTPIGGVWSGPGVSAAGIFTPDTSLIGSQTLTYSVTQNGCTVSATKIVTVTSPPVVNGGTNQTICAAASPLQLTGFSPVGGSWSGPGVNLVGVFTPGNNLIGTQTLTYSVTQNGCTVSSTKEITVTAPPIVLAGTAEQICANSSPVQLTSFSPAGGTWSGPGVSASGIFTPNNNLVGYQTLTYTVNQNGCTESATKLVIVKPIYENFLGADTVVCEGEEITLRVTVPSSNYLWNDGSQYHYLKVSQSGKYWAQGILEGCVFSDTIQVTFTKCPKFFIPNIITPNNDGKNDTFSPQNLPAGKWELQTYNRWGVKLFETEDYQNNWPDKKISDGTYYYLLRNSETGQHFKGWVEVVQ